MSNRPFFIYWNELSFPEEIKIDDLIKNSEWKKKATAAMQALLNAISTRSDCRISFSKGAFLHNIGDRPLQNWLEEWVGKDALRRLKARAVHPSTFEKSPAHDLECELICLNRSGEGLTRAHLAESWTWSLGDPNLSNNNHSIDAKKITINSKDDSAVKVSNIATQEHFKYWTLHFDSWGKTIAKGHIICRLGSYEIIMYPFDHGYAHVHVHAVDMPSLNAKYRIDLFDPLTNNRPAGLDNLVRPWMEKNRDSLLASWARCQNGGYPLQIE